MAAVPDAFWLGLAAKMATSAGIVVLASLAVERAGPFLGAMIATLPISAGPSYVFLALEHDPAFLERSSLFSVAVNAATAVFLVLYVKLAERGLLLSLGVGLGCWAVLATGIAQLRWSLLGAAGVNIAAYGAAFLLTRNSAPPALPGGSAGSRRSDLLFRAVGVMAVVAAVVLSGRLLGPKVAGILALLPVVFTSLSVVLHNRLGGAVTAAVLTNSLPGMVGFTAALLVLHVTVVPLGSALALTLALGVCVGWNGLLIVLRRLGVRLG